MKKVVMVILSLVLAFGSMSALAGCGKDRSLTLKLYSQGEYMDPDIYPEFEAWYKEQTGLPITVTMDNFDSNEAMLTKIELDKADYDLICPSDYMIEKMSKKGLLKKIDSNRVDVKKVILPQYVEMTKNFDKNLEYSVPFMYGTFGIMYNYKKTAKHLDSWESLFTAEFDKDIYTKKSPRDAYSSACIYAMSNELSAVGGANFENTNTPEYKKAIQGIFENTTPELRNKAKTALVEQKKHLIKYDEEDGKYQMAQNNGAAGLFWSCDAGYVMGKYESDDGGVYAGNKDLWYIIPKEGGSVYLDSFVLSKYAGNERAANYFLEFLCKKEIAKQNSLYIGAISPVTEAYNELEDEIKAMPISGDAESFFNGVTEEWKNMYLEMMFPSIATLNRCGMMRDYGDAEDAILQTVLDIVG